MKTVLVPWLCRAVSGAQARWKEGPPRPGQCIYFANHTSNLDFLILWSLLPVELRCRTRPVAAHDYWTADRIRHLVARDLFNAVLIERKKVTKSNNPLNAMCSALDEGSSLIVFPEGGRRRGDGPGMMPFKSGLFHLAMRFPLVDLVPVYLHNMNRIMPAGEWLVVPLICSVVFGRPMRRLEGEGKENFLRRAEAAVMEAAA
jgi:1-acyl-sn-glycerol-3-phosphate acyltransferase